VNTLKSHPNNKPSSIKNKPQNETQNGEVIPFSTSHSPFSYSPEAERSVLGGVMLTGSSSSSKDILELVLSILTVDDFYEKRHQLLWSAIFQVIMDGVQPDLITVVEQLKKNGHLEVVNSQEGYLGVILNNTPGTANLLAYVKIVREYSLQREITMVKQALLNAGREKETELLTQLRAANDAFDRLKNQCGECLFDQLKQSFSDNVAMEFEAVQWIVQDILPAGVTMLCAKPKQGKSWLALDLAMAVAAGTSNTLGCKQAVKGDVLYFALEDNQRRMNTRLKKLVSDRFESAPSNAYLITGTTVPRLNQGFEVELEKYLERHPETRLVVIDPFTFIETPPKRNQSMRSYQEDYEAINRLTSLTREKYPHVAILLIYHMRKEGSGNWLDTVMGTTGLAGAVDNLMFMRRENAQSDAVFYLTGKDIEDEREYAMTFDKVTVCWQLLGDAEEYAMSHERREIVDCLKGGMTHYKEIAESVDKRAKTVHKILQSMCADGQVKALGNGDYALVDTTPQCEVDIGEDDNIPASVTVTELTPQSAVDRVDGMDVVDGVDVVDTSVTDEGVTAGVTVTDEGVTEGVTVTEFTPQSAVDVTVTDEGVTEFTPQSAVDVTVTEGVTVTELTPQSAVDRVDGMDVVDGVDVVDTSVTDEGVTAGVTVTDEGVTEGVTVTEFTPQSAVDVTVTDEGVTEFTPQSAVDVTVTEGVTVTELTPQSAVDRVDGMDVVDGVDVVDTSVTDEGVTAGVTVTDEGVTEGVTVTEFTPQSAVDVTVTDEGVTEFTPQSAVDVTVTEGVTVTDEGVTVTDEGVTVTDYPPCPPLPVGNGGRDSVLRNNELPAVSTVSTGDLGVKGGNARDEGFTLSEVMQQTLIVISKDYNTPAKASQYLRPVKAGTMRKRFMVLRKKGFLSKSGGVYSVTDGVTVTDEGVTEFTPQSAVDVTVTEGVTDDESSNLIGLSRDAQN